MKSNILLKRITRDPGILAGKPIVRGMRIGVDTILNDLASGLSFTEIIEQHPMVDEKDIKACILYAEKSMEELNKLKKTA